MKKLIVLSNNGNCRKRNFWYFSFDALFINNLFRSDYSAEIFLVFLLVNLRDPL